MKWATLNGWRDRGDGWLANTAYHPGWLRTADGRWWAAADVSEGILKMTPTGPRVVPGWFLNPNGYWSQEAGEIDEIRQRIGEVVNTDAEPAEG